MFHILIYIHVANADRTSSLATHWQNGICYTKNQCLV